MDDIEREFEHLKYWEKTGDNLDTIAFSNSIFLSINVSEDSKINNLYKVFQEQKIDYIKSINIVKEKINYYKDYWLDDSIEIKDNNIIDSIYEGYLTKNNSRILDLFLNSIKELVSNSNVKRIRLIITGFVDIEQYENIIYKEVLIKDLNNILLNLPETHFSSAIFDIYR